LIFHLLHQKFGLDFLHYKSDMIARRVERRVKLSGVSGLESYADLLTEEGDEINLLYHDMLIGVTDFFRDCKVFERLQLDVIPSAVDNLHEDEEFRCWVAGTASGEEAYSLAILLAEEFSKRGIEQRIRIFASDVHEQSLAAAGRGVYSHDQLGNVTPERRERFFIERQDGFHVAPELRKMVVFTPHNVIRDAPFTRLDLITCRNLLIYFTPPTQQRVLSLFHFGLKTGGTLCLGGSESLGNLRSEFQAIDETSRIFRKDREVPSTGIRGTLNRVAWTHATDKTPPPDRDATRQLLKRLNCPALLVNEKREVLHVLGGAGKYLVFSDGRPTNDVLQVIHPELRSHLSLALIHLRRDKHPVTVEPVKCEINNQVTGIALTVETFESGDDEAQTVLITLQVTDISADAEVSPTLLSAAELSNVEHLERELQFKQDNLQSTIEELQSTNKELQSTNEQMTASNEELQSTNEELHSVNEELYTVNAEHQRKNELRTGKVDLRHIVEQAISVVRRSLNDADLSFSVEMPTEALVVDGDPARLEQVTVNLLTNAIKYTPAGGDIRLSLQAEGGFGVIEVQDTGVGIPRDKLQEIFSLFYQSDETLDRSNGGMGVGLTLVMAVVELHKGKVTARSNGPGRGSTFTVTLPLSTSAQLAVAGPVARPSVAIRQVVLVEDIDDAREMLATLLALRGLSVHEGRDGAEGLELIRKVRPDAAIIDIGLPEMDGHEVARRIRNDSSFDDVRLVALNGYGQDTDRAAVRESGFDLHLVKPLSPESLDTILPELVDIQRGPTTTNV